MQPKLVYIEQPTRRYTFEMPKLKQWVESICEGKVLNLFAGKTKLNIDEIRNDIDTAVFADYHMDAFDFVNYWEKQKNPKFNTIILDPPYTSRKSMEKYGGRMISNFQKVKELVPSILEGRGLVIFCGYSSSGMGKCRGFSKEQICLIGHGGSHEDTIVLVERKVSNYLV